MYCLESRKTRISSIQVNTLAKSASIYEPRSSRLWNRFSVDLIFDFLEIDWSCDQCSRYSGLNLQSLCLEQLCCRTYNRTILSKKGSSRESPISIQIIFKRGSADANTHYRTVHVSIDFGFDFDRWRTVNPKLIANYNRHFWDRRPCDKK